MNKPWRTYYPFKKVGEEMKSWEIQIVDEAGNTWDTKLVGRGSKRNIWEFTIFGEQSKNLPITSFFGTQQLISLIRTLREHRISEYGYVSNRILINEDGTMVVFYAVKKKTIFPPSEREKLGDLLKEIPVLQVLGILEGEE